MADCGLEPAGPGALERKEDRLRSLSVRELGEGLDSRQERTDTKLS